MDPDGVVAGVHTTRDGTVKDGGGLAVECW